ncbi:pirin family protein [Polaribacter sp.]|nr:pirin family protein [Polaribacter sp.]
MKKVIHKASSRGYANHGWLQSYHTFSFARYYNPERMNFGMLRVLNDDIVQPNMGFGTHPHKNMEIISIPISGALSHKDSMNNKRAIEVGEIQVMSAGSGITHSEFNDSKTEETNFLQLWILPEEENVTPYYNQKEFPEAERKNKLQVIVSPRTNAIEGSLVVYQQAFLYLADLDENVTIDYNLKNSAYIFLIEGEIAVANETLQNRDAIGISNTKKITIKANKKSKLLLIDVPMK